MNPVLNTMENELSSLVIDVCSHITIVSSKTYERTKYTKIEKKNKPKGKVNTDLIASVTRIKENVTISKRVISFIDWMMSV